MTTMTVLESWWFFAAFLPIIVGALIQQGWSKRAQATTAVIVYVLYGLIGSYLGGQFMALSWVSMADVLTSIMAVAMIAYTSYQTLWRAFPIPGWVEEHTGGDPLVEVTPNANVA